MQGWCHEHVLELSKVREMLDDFYAVTALARRCFKGGYYHSYSYNPTESVVIDLTCNAVVKVPSYYNIFQPIPLASTQNKDLPSAIVQAKSVIQQPVVVDNGEMNDLMQVALYRHIVKNHGHPPADQKIILR